MNISSITTEIIDLLSKEFKKEENQTKIRQEMIDPIIMYTFDRLYPYIATASVIFILTFLLAITVLVLIIRTLTLT